MFVNNQTFEKQLRGIACRGVVQLISAVHKQQRQLGIVVNGPIKKSKAKLLGFASLIDRSSKKSLKIKKSKIVSQIKINVPTYNKNNLPTKLKNISITSPGSRYLR